MHDWNWLPDRSERHKASRGRQPNPPSAVLRNLAWMRFLLDRLPDVASWATGSTPPPASWHRRCAQDARHLTAVFQNSPHLLAQSKAGDRPVSLLDRVFSEVLGGSGGGGRYFGDRLYRGRMRPSPSHLARFEEMVPGSRAAFEHEPPGMDRWFYDALDVQSPWFGRFFLLRAQDPQFRDPEWTEAGLLVASGPDDGRGDAGVPVLSEAVRARRDDRWDGFDGDEVLRDQIRGSPFHAIRPDLAYAEDSVVDEAFSSLEAAAAAGEDPKRCAELSPLWNAPLAMRWAALSNAVAVHRVATMVRGNTPITRWCLQAAREALQADIEAAESEKFCRVAGRVGPVSAVLDAIASLCG